MSSRNGSIHILGISAFYHDSAACLVRDGKIIAAAQEERFTRKKYDASFPVHAIQYCLKEAGISAQGLNFVGYYEKPFLKFERLLLTYLQYAPFGLASFLQAMPVWLKQKIFLKDLIRQELGYEGEIIFTEHHESHAASAFYPSPFQQAAILTMDGVGEWTTTSFGVGDGNKIQLSHEIKFPHSLGLLYSAFTYYVGFRVNSGEYKLMGLAPYGKPKYVDLIKKELVDIKEDGSFKLNMKYFNYCAGLTMTNARFHKLFGGQPRKPEFPIRQKDMDIARSIQDVTEEIMLKMANYVHDVTKKENLCLAGGVALNCVGNGRILRQGKFKKIWIQPAAGDAGGALGVALFIWHRYLDRSRKTDNVHDEQQGSYLGPRYGDQEIEALASRVGARYERVRADELPKRIAQYIDERKVIGIVQGRMEFGPRALGARSVIADARSQEMQSILNLKVKFRESFRPFAPSVLEEKAGEYFDLTCPSPYMLLVSPVREDKTSVGNAQERVPETILERLKQKRSVIPAVTHVDYSARIQTVSREVNPLYYNIIEEFFKRTGCPVIINTSFNIRGEPIVCTPQDAYQCFMCTDMDYLVMSNCIFDKTKQPQGNKYKKEDISQVLD
jgi:carbamoyltransferase